LEIQIKDIGPIPVAAQSKTWMCDLSLAGNVGSNPVGAMDVFCLVRVVCCQVGGLRRVDPSFREDLPSVCVSLSVIKCNNNPLDLHSGGRKRLE
jgi:hypothetical protein